MKRLVIILTVLLTASAGVADAALDFSQYIPESQVLAVNSTTDADLGGIAFINSDATKALFFDTDPGNDSLLLYDHGTITNYETKAQISSGGASENDMTADSSGNVYALLRDSVGTRLYKYPANMDYTHAIEMVPTGSLTGANRLVVDEAHNRLYLGYVAGFSSGGTTRLAYVALDAVNATPTILTDNTAILAAIGSSTVNDDDCADLTMLANGNVLWANGYYPDTPNDMLEINSSTGAVTTFAAKATLIAAAGGNPASDGLGNVQLTTLSNGRILGLAANVSGGIQRCFLMGSADGSQWAKVCDESLCSDDADFPGTGTEAPFSIYGGSLEQDASGNVYWGQGYSGDYLNECFVKMSGIDVNLDLTPHDPDIAVSSTLDFGTINSDANKTLTLTVHNGGATHDLHITNASSISGASFSLDTALPLSIGPGADGSLNVTFKPMGATGLSTGTLTLVNDDSDTSHDNKQVDLSGASILPGSIPLLITQILDGNMPGGKPKALELTNSGDAPVDLSQYSVRLGSNGNPFGAPIVLSGMLAAGDSYTISASDTDTPTAYEQLVGKAPDLINGVVNINGDDTIGLFNADGTIMYDIFGQEGVDANAATPNEAWDYENSSFYRKSFVHFGNTTWNGSEWTKVGPLPTDVPGNQSLIGTGAAGNAKIDFNAFTSNNAAKHWELFE